MARFEKEIITTKAQGAQTLTELADSLNLSRQALMQPLVWDLTG